MGKVAAEIKVMPKSPEVDLDALQERLEKALPEDAKITKVDRENVAFGLTALMVNVMIPDDEGGTGKVEEAFSEDDEVESVTTENVGRV